MKALAHRLRGRRASRRGDGLDQDETERSFRFEEAVKEAPEERRDDNWRKNRGINSKTGSCNTLAALAAASTHPPDSADVVPPSFVNSPPLEPKPKSRTASAVKMESPQHQRQLRAHSNSRVNSVAAALRPHGDDRSICMSGSSSSSHSQASNSSAGRRTRSRHGGSIGSNASFLSVSNQRPEVAVDVRHSGYLVIKRGLLKVADKRYYFVARRSPELYSCKDETSFNLWLASGHPLDPYGGGDAIARASGLSPVLVGTVLRADGSSEEAGNNGGNNSEKVFSVVVGVASKCFTLRFGTDSGEKATEWLEALQEVQVTKRNGNKYVGKTASALEKRLLLSSNEHNALRGTVNSEKSTGDTVVVNVVGDVVLVDETNEESEPVATRPASTSNAKMPRVYAGGKLQSKPRVAEENEVLTPTSHTESSPTSASATSEHMEALAVGNSITSTQVHPPVRLRRMDSVTSGSSTASGQSQGSSNGNVLLFVPVAGSSLTASASRMAKAQQELETLVAKGAKLPSRIMHSPANGETIEWRYGIPEYVLTDLAYVKGRMREPDTTPLASYVEECCQTFIMEATHKARYDQWRSVVQESFYLQVNDGVRVPGSSILENDMLGLLYLGDAEASIGADHGGSEENQDPRAELAEAFPDGFPMEVLDVFTQPPQCYFSWRHWGSFTGKYRGIKGDGSKIEVRGFGEMTVDASHMRSLRLFFKQKDLVAGLRQVTDNVVRPRRDTTSVAALSSIDSVPGRNVRAVSAAVAPSKRRSSSESRRDSEWSVFENVESSRFLSRVEVFVVGM